MSKQQGGCIAVDPDGGLQVAIYPQSVAQFTCLVPMPWTTVIQRQQEMERARWGAWLHGYWIERERWIRNELSDRGKDRTTLELTLRPCRTAEEAEFVASKVAEMVRGYSGWARQ